MLEIMQSLGIRPTQLVIQTLGFLILLAVLIKVLWKPIMGLMEAREKEVGDTYAKAEAAHKEAEDLKAEYRTRVVKIEEEAQEKLAEAVKRGNKMGEDIVAAARNEADMEKVKAMNAIKEEAGRARSMLRDYALGLSFELASKILQKEVSKSSHEDLVKSFINELDALSAEKS